MTVAPVPSARELAQAFRLVASWFEAQAEATQQAPEWIAQANSLAGRRRHIGECRRLVAAGSDQARIVGRKYLLTRAAVDALLGRVSSKHTEAVPNAASHAPQAVDELAELRAKLEGRRAA